MYNNENYVGKEEDDERTEIEEEYGRDVWHGSEGNGVLWTVVCDLRSKEFALWFSIHCNR